MITSHLWVNLLDEQIKATVPANEMTVGFLVATTYLVKQYSSLYLVMLIKRKLHSLSNPILSYQISIVRGVEIYYFHI